MPGFLFLFPLISQDWETLDEICNTLSATLTFIQSLSYEPWGDMKITGNVLLKKKKTGVGHRCWYLQKAPQIILI